MTSNRLAIIGILLGITGAGLLALFVSTASSTSDDVPTIQVLMAPDQGLTPGTTAEAVETVAVAREVPADVAPARALLATSEVEGQRVVRQVGPGEILTTDQFGTTGPAVGGVIVQEGWEALTVEAAPAPGLQGYATPGSLVNLYWTSTEPASVDDGDPTTAPEAPQAFTQLVMAHTEVLAVTRGTLTGEAQQVDGASSPAGVFLLKVRPADVPTLLYAEQHGELWFTLTNAEDPSPTAVRVTFDALEPGALQASIEQARTQLEADRAAAVIDAGDPADGVGTDGTGAGTDAALGAEGDG